MPYSVQFRRLHPPSVGLLDAEGADLESLFSDHRLQGLSGSVRCASKNFAR